MELQLFAADNPHLAAADLHVHPDQRRVGVGTALLAELERRVTEAERTALLMEVFVTPGEPSPGREFALQHGFAVAIGEGVKACDLPATEDRWDALEAEAAQLHDGYRIVTWQRRVPDDLRAAYCRLQSVFLDEAPLVRERDDRLEGAGRHQIVTDNADVNVHTNAVNDRLGFVTVEHLLELRKTWPRP